MAGGSRPRGNGGALMPLYEVGDGKPYATIQGAINAMPGNLAAGGVQKVEVHAKAATGNVYIEQIDAVTGFINPSAADYIHIEGMIEHNGILRTGIIIDPNIGLNPMVVIDLTSYSRMTELQVSNSPGGFAGTHKGIWGNTHGIRLERVILYDMSGSNQLVEGIKLGYGAKVINCIVSKIGAFCQ